MCPTIDITASERANDARRSSHASDDGAFGAGPLAAVRAAVVALLGLLGLYR